MSPHLLAGSVVLEDGTPPPEPVVVQRVCHGAPPIPETYTNARGQFTIELGRDSTVRLDAEYGMAGGPDLTDLMGCELRAELTGFSSDAIDLGARRVMDNPNVGSIVLRRLEGVTGSVFSRTALRASREARKAFERGHELAADEKLDEAREEYEKAVRLYPEFATAWYELGLVHQMLHRIEDARAAHREAVAADPEYVKPYRRLSTLAFEEMRWEELAEVAGRVVELDPVSYADAHLHLAASSFFLGRLATAESSARQAIELDPEGAIPNARYVLGVVLLDRGEYAEAAESLREYLAMAAPGPDVDRAASLLEQVEAAGAER
jgi:Flp pilus assembly protein TadD